jgi:predicted metalloprotease
MIHHGFQNLFVALVAGLIVTPVIPSGWPGEPTEPLLPADITASPGSAQFFERVDIYVTAVSQDVDAFMRRYIDEAYKGPLYVVTYDQADTACGILPPEVVGGYCDGDNTVYLNGGRLAGIALAYGETAVDMLVVQLASHHALSANGLSIRQPCLDPGTGCAVETELLADCLTGAFAATTLFPRDSAVSGMVEFMLAEDALPTGSPLIAFLDHGPVSQRIDRLYQGFYEGPDGCITPRGSEQALA